MMIESVAYPETAMEEGGARPATLRSIYVAAVAERCAELGSPLSGVERLGYEARAAELFPEEAV